MEIRAFRRADATLPQAHGPEAVQVPSLSAIVFAERSFVASHEKALIKWRVQPEAGRRERRRRRRKRRKVNRCSEEYRNSRVVIVDDDDDSFFFFFTFGT